MRTVVLVAACTLLVACAGGFKRDLAEPRVYRLSIPEAPAGAPLEVNLLVLKPVIPPGLRTERIATVWPGNRVDYYAGARWSGELGAVLQGSLVQGIRRSGRLKTVEGDPGRFRATHVLGVEVERFEADYRAGEPPRARVALTGTVARYGDRRALATFSTLGEAVAVANTLDAVTTAIDGAYGQASLELIAQALVTLAAEGPGQP